MHTMGLIRQTVTVGNSPMGLHMRPAMAFAKLANTVGCSVKVFLGEKQANGRSPMELLMLFAPPGTELTLELDGDDAERILQPLIDILTEPGGEDESHSGS
jgi:phosphotransferase system HPr (HPr) family protein